jgi:uncharacterized membrane protein
VNTTRLETFADGVFAIAVTFFTIGIVWVNHHTVMSQIARADRVFLFLNIGFLMFVAIAALYILESSLFGRTKQSS